MPPRFAYWTILAGGQPTAFRAATSDELLPTLKQLQSKHPDAVMMWFARGKLWPSEEAAAMALRMQREGRDRGERRGAAWRPGGEHKDPRDRFKVPRDVKRQRFATRLRRDRTEEQGGERPPFAPKTERPGGQRPFRPGRGASGERPFSPKGERPFSPKGAAGGGGDRPFRPRSKGGAQRFEREGGPKRHGAGGQKRQWRGGGPKGGRGGGGHGQR